MIDAAEWETLCYLIEEAWPGEFDQSARAAWRTLLDGYTALQVSEAMKVLLLRGGRFRPAVSELIAEINHDPGQPTFTEAFQLIYGRNGVLRAREPYSGPVLDPELSRDRAALARAGEMHPLILAFVQTYGLDRLRLLKVDDPDHGELVRKELGSRWEEFVSTAHDRGVAVLAAGRRGEMGRFDPLSALPRGNG